MAHHYVRNNSYSCTAYTKNKMNIMQQIIKFPRRDHCVAFVHFYESMN